MVNLEGKMLCSFLKMVMCSWVSSKIMNFTAEHIYITMAMMTITIGINHTISLEHLDLTNLMEEGGGIIG